MGGQGSGRWYQGGKDVTSDYCSLDVKRLQRDNLLIPGRSFVWNWYVNNEKTSSIQVQTQEDRIILDYRHQKANEEWKSLHYPVMLSWTACHYGSQRAWFICPANGCGRRVALLYLGGSGIFACRHCYQLAYACQREASYDRTTRRADRIRKQLGWEPGIFNGKRCKPKGMHWKTYQKLVMSHDDFVHASLIELSHRVEIMKK